MLSKNVIQRYNTIQSQVIRESELTRKIIRGKLPKHLGGGGGGPDNCYLLLR